MVKQEAVEGKFADVTWLRVSKVWWSLTWRITLVTFIVGIIAGFIIGFIMRLAGADLNSIAISVQISIVIVSCPVGIVAMRAVLKKHYSDFSIALIVK